MCFVKQINVVADYFVAIGHDVHAQVLSWLGIYNVFNFRTIRFPWPYLGCQRETGVLLYPGGLASILYER